MNSSSFSGKKDSIFEVMPDEAAFSLHFKSDLLSKNPFDVEKPLIPPSESVIVDIITDPAVFTRMSTSLEAWQGVITPLFTGTDETQPFLHQIIREFIRYLKEREIIFLEIADKEFELINFQRKVRYDAILIIYSEYNPPYPFIDYSKLENLINSSDIGKIIPDKHYFLPNPIYTQTTKKVIANLLSKNSYFTAQIAIKWGFFACDIGPILNALLFFIRALSSSTVQGNPSSLNLPSFIDIIPRLSLENAAFLPISNENERFSTKIMGYRRPYIQTRSTIVSNGKHLFVLGSDSSMTRISLSNYDQDKFKNYTFNSENISKAKYSTSNVKTSSQSSPNFHNMNDIDLFITVSNGYMLISSNILTDREIIYSLEPFVKCSGAVSYRKSNLIFKFPKVVEPVASDGQYIYSLCNSKQINVFSLTFQEIIFVRSIELKKGNEELNKKYPILIPKNWQNEAIMYTNGVIVSFLVCKPLKENEIQYFVRHFSLLTGCHVEDVTFHLDFQIVSIAYDPWNRCQWIVTHTNRYDSDVIKMPAEGSLPPWLTGVNSEDVSGIDLKKTITSFSTIKSNANAVMTISDFLNYFLTHFVGSSFKSQRIGNHVITAQFFGLTSLESLIAAVESITSLISMFNSSNHKNSLDKAQIRKTLSALVYFLQYNLSNNFTIETFHDDSLKSLSIRIIDLFNHILTNNNLSFLHIPASITLITSFSVLFKWGYLTLPPTFSIIYQKLFKVSHDLVYFAIQFLSSNNLFQYSFSPSSYGEICLPILNRLLNNNIEYPSTIFILISKFQCSLVTEIRRIITQQQDKSKQQEILLELFFNYSQSIIEIMTAYLETPIDYLTRILPNSNFISLFRKWIMLIHPLHEFKVISHTLLFYIHNLMSKFIEVFKQSHKSDINLISPDKKRFDFVYCIFFELFTAYTDFMCSDFKYKIDLNEVMKYIFFTNAAIESKISKKLFLEISSILIDPSNTVTLEQKKETILKFNSIDKNTVNIYLELLLQEDKPDIKLLFDFLYSKAKGNINKRLTDEERYIERIIFTALMKQFGFVSNVIELINKLKNSQTPEVSAIIKNSMEFLYRIRRELQQSRQMTIQANEKQNQTKENDEENNPNNIDNIELIRIKQNYPKYIQLLKEKCIFLISIEQIFINININEEQTFSKARKMIQSFILSKYDAFECFRFIESVNLAKENIATGLNLMNEIIKSDINITYSTYLLRQFISSRRIIKYITTYQMISDKPGKSTKEFIFKEIDVMLSILCNMIIDIPIINLSNLLMIFYSKSVLALEKCNFKLAFKSIKRMIKHLFIKRKEMAQAHFSTSLSLILSCLFILMNDNKDKEMELFNLNLKLDESKSSEKIQLMDELKSIIYENLDEIDPDLLSATKLLFYSGMSRPYNSFKLIDYLRNCDIKYYHSGFSVLSDLIHTESNSDKEKIFNFFLDEIGKICCGSRTVFMSQMKLIDQIDLKKVIINDNTELMKIKTPNLILNVCNYLILFCRRCLEKDIEISNEKDRIETRDTLINLFNEILSRRYDFDKFVKQVAVFAIISNSINSFRKNSLFKFITNNSIYYISDININDQAFFCWHLPIHEKSKPRWIPRTNELFPISFFPFSPEMYDQQTLLFPFFKHALNTNRSNRDTVLNFFVLSSLTSYLSSKDFVQYFIDKVSKVSNMNSQLSTPLNENNLFKMNRITFSENQEMFLYLLNQHLTKKSSGFLHINKPEPYFHLISPADIISYSCIDTSSKSTVDNSNLNIDSNPTSAILINRKEIKFNRNNCSGFHCFATSVLHIKQPSFLEVDFNEYLCVGINSFSINQNLSSTYLVSGISGTIIFNSYPIKRIPKLSLMHHLTIEFNPLNKRATIFDNKSNRIHSIKLSSSSACFFIYNFNNKKTIKYKLSHIPAQRSLISSDAAKYLCPFSGKVLFKHKKRPLFASKSESEEKSTLNESLKMFPIKTLTDLNNIATICFKQNMSDSMFEQIDDLNPTKFYKYENISEKVPSEKVENENNNNNDNDDDALKKRHHRRNRYFDDNSDKNPFLIYPQTVINECSGSLNIKKLIDIDNFPIRIVYSKTSSKFTKLENSSNISTISHTPVYYSTHSSNTFSLLSRFDDVNENLFKIDSMNGDVLPLTEKLWPVFQLMPLHPLNYHILATELINFFATGYVTNYRHELINRVFYRAFSLNVLPIPSLMKLFSFDETKLLEYMIYLMLYIEPIRIKMISESVSPVDFNYNVLEQNSGSSSKYHQKKLAVNSIFTYFDQKEVFLQIISKWFALLQKQFQDFGCHFVSFHHPQATIVPSSVLTDSASSGSSFYSVLKTSIKKIKFIRIPLASQLIVFKSEFSHNSPTVANIQIPLKSSDSIESSEFESFELSNNIVLVEGDSVIISPESNCTHDDFSVVVLPIFSTSNESLFDTFFNFIISMKYFVIFLSKHLNEITELTNENDSLIHLYRTKVYEMVIDSFLIESPFFFNYMSDILTFLQIKIPLIGSDLSPDFTMKLMLLSAYTDIKRFPFIKDFLQHQQTMWDERMVIPLKLFFPEFLSNSDKSNISTILNDYNGDDENKEKLNLNNFGLPSPPIPDVLDFDNDLSQTAIHVKRTMKIRNSIVGYPFHLIIQMWAYYAAMLPPFKYEVINDRLIKVMFSSRFEAADENCPSFLYSPSEVEFICGLQIQPKIRYAYNKEMTENVSDFHKKCHIYVPQNKPIIFIEVQDESISFNRIHFAFISISSNTTDSNDNDYSFSDNDSLPPDLFIKKYREKFISDVKKLVEIGTSEDEKLLSCFPISKFLKDSIMIKIDPISLLKDEVDFQSIENHRNNETANKHSYCDGYLPILCVRSSLLFAFNWLLYNDKISFDDDPTLRPLCHSMSPLLSVKKLNHLIDEQSNEEQAEVTVDRSIAHDVRNGSSDKISNTIIAQLSRQYKNSTLFRCRGDKPWRVYLVDENGFDAGGPGREVLSEISNDISSPNCGLFVETPDSRSGLSGKFLIPVSDPRLLAKEAQMQYRFVGVFIGVCIRSSTVQRLSLAPLVWNFLATGELTIEDIFEIDNQYKHLITSLEEVLRNFDKEKGKEQQTSHKAESEFDELFDLRFVVNNSRGEEVPLTQRGRFEKVTLANCSDFISMANEFRLNEIRQNLEEMREGLWENLNIKPPAFISGKLLENATCGERELTYEALKRIITFNNVPYNQQQFVLKVIKNFSSDERSQFLRFITGRVMLPSLEILQDEPSGNGAVGGAGMNKLINNFIIKVDQMKGQVNKLPTASTCFNQLHIPEYSSYEKAKEMISIAIKYTGTFENR